MCHTHAQPKSASQRIGPFPIFLKYWRGFQGMEVKAIKMTFLSPFFFAIFGQHRFKHGLPHMLIKPVGK